MKISIETNGPLLEVFSKDNRLVKAIITDNQLETYDREREELRAIVENLKMIKRVKENKEPKEGLGSFIKFKELIDIVSIDAGYIGVVFCRRKEDIQLYLAIHKDKNNIVLAVSYDPNDFKTIGGLTLARVDRFLGSDDIRSAYNALDRMVEWDRVWDKDYLIKRQLIQDELEQY